MAAGYVEANVEDVREAQAAALVLDSDRPGQWGVFSQLGTEVSSAGSPDAAFLSKPASAEPCLHTRALAGICSGFMGRGSVVFRKGACGAARFLGLSLGGRMSSVGCRSGVPAESLLASDTETT